MTYAEIREYYRRMSTAAERFGWDGAAADAIHSLGNRLADESHIPDDTPVPDAVLKYYDVPFRRA